MINWTSTTAGLRRELPQMLGLASPIVLGEIGWMAMGVVDTMMVGRVSAAALGAMGIGRILFMAIAVCGIGLLLGLDTRISQAHGAGDRRECNRLLVQGTYLALLFAVGTFAVTRVVSSLLDLASLKPEVQELMVPYLSAVSWSALPLFLYTATRRYLQSLNLVRPVMFALVSANLVNIAANWLLIFGNLGAPALGAAGAGWATCFSMLYMTLFLTVAVILRGRDERESWRGVPLGIDRERVVDLLRLGFPAATQLVLEVGVFAVAGLLAGRLTAEAMAAHQVALTVASGTFMVPLGVASAAAVRVGQAIGRQDPIGAGHAGWAAMLLGGGFMSLAGLVLILWPAPVMRLFTDDVEVVAIGVPLLVVAALFQLFDGFQVVATGALRGAGDTRNPMVWNLIGHWLIGLPIGYVLCFRHGQGIVGLWIGLSVGLTLIGIVLLFVWSRRVRALGPAPSPAG